MFQQGPWHGVIRGIGTTEGKWPLEVRCGDMIVRGDGLTTEAAVYRMHDVENSEGLFFGSYTFVGMKEVAQTLIDVWM